MNDVEIRLDDRPGALAEMGKALGRAGVSIEGGGGFVIDRKGILHLLFRDGGAARRVLEAAKIEVRGVHDIVAVRLRQAEPGQLGHVARAMAGAGVNVEAMYSDHANRLILVVDRPELAQLVAQEWSRSEAREDPA